MLSTNISEREKNKFREVSGNTAVAVANSDGTNVFQSGATVTIGGALGAGSNFIGLATTVIGSAPTLYAVVNTAAAGQASVVLDAGTRYVGLASVNIGGTLPALTAGAAYIGLASVNIGGTLPALSAGSNFIGLISAASIQGKVQLVAGTAYAGLASVNIGGTLPALSTGSNFIGLTTTVIGSAPTIYVVGSVKTHKFTPIALSATNLSGATALVGAANKNYYITKILLSTASNVGLTFLNGATYLTGNASIRMQLAPQGGLAYPGEADSPLFVSLANQTNFLIATDTAAPVAGSVSWYEE